MSKLDDILATLQGGRTAEVGQGLTFGLGDEIGAAMQAAGEPNPHEVSKTYHQALSENQGQLSRQQAAEPKLSAALEALGSVPSMFISPAGGEAGVAAKDLQLSGKLGGAPLTAGLGRAAAAGFVPGAVSGFGHSTADSLGGKALDTLKGGLAGAGLGGVARFGANAVSQIPAVQRALAGLSTRNLQAKMAAGTADDAAAYRNAGNMVNMDHPLDRTVSMPASGYYTEPHVDPLSGRTVIPQAQPSEMQRLDAMLKAKQSAQTIGDAHLRGDQTIPGRPTRPSPQENVPDIEEE